LKFWTGIIKLNTLPSIVQNFAAELRDLARKKKKRNKPQQNPLRRLSLPSGLIKFLAFFLFFFCKCFSFSIEYLEVQFYVNDIIYSWLK